MTEDTTVVVDRNEPEHVRLRTLSHDDVDEWTEQFLDAADVIVNGVGVERKTPSDFASSMLEKRLDEQVRKLADAYDDAAILLEGGFDDFEALDHTGLNPQSARGKAASVHMRFGIPVVPVGGEPGTDEAADLLVDYAVRLGRKATEEPTSGYLPTGAVGSDEPLGKRLWGCFDGIGPTRAEALFEEVGSPTEFAVKWMEFVPGGSQPDHIRSPDDVDRKTLTEIDGIGEKTAERLVEQLRGE